MQTWANGNVDATNISATLAQAAIVNQAGQVVKGAVNIATSESRTNTAYGLLATPDQVTGLVLPANGLIAVWYQATWQESVNSAAAAAIFLNGNQTVSAFASGAPSVQNTIISGGNVNKNVPLFTFALGLQSLVDSSTQYSGDLTTGQAIGGGPTAGGPCYLFAAAGTYTVAIMFKSSSGSVTASNRKLWVQAMSFA